MLRNCSHMLLTCFSIYVILSFNRLMLLSPFFDFNTQLLIACTKKPQTNFLVALNSLQKVF